MKRCLLHDCFFIMLWFSLNQLTASTHPPHQPLQLSKPNQGLLLRSDGSLSLIPEIQFKNQQFTTQDGQTVHGLLELRYPQRVAREHPSLFTTDGQRWAGELKTWSRSKGITWITPESQELNFPLEGVECLVFQGQRQSNSETSPFVQLKSGKRVLGTISYITPNSISLKSSFGKIKLDRDTVHYIQLAQRSPRPSTGPHLIITNTGHRWRGRLEKLDEQQCVFVVAERKMNLAPSSIIQLRDMKANELPRTFQHQSTAFLEQVDPPQWDSNAQGHDLAIAQLPLWQGLSLHSKTECDFNLGAPSSHFIFRLAMDRSYEHLGPCVLKLKAGSIQKSWELNAHREASWEVVELKGASTLKLTLDYGNKGSSGDHVIIADPIIIPRGGQK